MKGAFKFPMIKRSGGDSPDPAVYCPANGYVNPNDPIQPWIEYPYTEEKGFVKILEFQTNSPNNKTFDPSINNSNRSYNLGWDCSEDFIITGVSTFSIYYKDNSVKTVKIYDKTVNTIITSVDFADDNIVGILDLSNAIFSPLAILSLNDNPSLTEVLFPAEFTAASVSTFRIYNTGFTGILDLRTLKNFPSQLYFWNNPNMTGILFPQNATGSINQIYAYSTGLTGVLDLSMLSNFTTPYFMLHTNPNLTGVIFTSNPITAACGGLQLQNTGISTLDLSMFVTLSTGATIYFNDNPNLLNVIMPVVNTGFISAFRCYNCPNIGYINFTGISTSKASQSIDIKNNNWTADIVNRILVDLNSISVAGFSSRTINIGGNNSDPDSSSGGYDGIAARNSLIAKGFNVIIT